MYFAMLKYMVSNYRLNRGGVIIPNLSFIKQSGANAFPVA